VTNQNPAEAGRREERRRIFSFLTTVCTIFFSGTGFVCATWNYFWGTPSMPGWWIAPFVLTGVFIGSLVAGLRHASPWLRLAYHISAVWLGLLNFCLFASIACWMTIGISSVFGLGLSRRVIADLFFGLAILASIWGYLNAGWLRVTRVTVQLPHLPPAWDGRDVVMMSDLHLGNVRGSAFTRRVVTKVRSLKPFAVFVCGDLFDGPKADYDRLVEPCRELSAPAGVYFVTGNHEEFSDRGKYISAVERAGLRVLNNEKVIVQGMQIIGVHDSEAVEPEVFKRILQDAAVERRQASILLSHRPSNLSIPEAAGISLQMSGHTHRGQFCPWCWIIYMVHGPFAYGLNRLGNLQVLTSCGAGTWGPPMRVGTKSEIVLIHLKHATGKA
jgi:hypothetical protein